MSITLDLADLAPCAYSGRRASKAEELFKGVCSQEHSRSKSLMRCSASDDFLSANHVSASTNGLVYSAIAAWSSHHHLILRPEDIWFAILTQLSFYINAHAEELRSFFVAHDRQKELIILHYDEIRDRDFGQFALDMTKLMEKEIVDSELRTWIMPDFTTTTDSDRIVAAILMMGAMKKYFAYTSRTACSIPTIKILGERSDWVTLLAKIEKISQLGSEPTKFVALLQPVLTRFVRAFEDPRNPEIIDFFNRIVQKGADIPVYKPQTLMTRSEAEGEAGLDTLAPLTGWLMYETASPEEVKKMKSLLVDKQRELEILGPIYDKAAYGTHEYERKTKLQMDVERLEELLAY